MEHLINLNFAPGGLPATVHVSQYDDTIRQLRFQLWFGRSKVEVPSGASVRVDIKKPDGHIVLVNGTVNSSDRSIVTVPTTKQMTAVPGGSRGTLVISSTGDKRISSAIFILQVHRDPVEDGDASDSDLSMLQDAIDQTAANASAAAASAAEAQEAAESFTTDTTLSATGKAADAKKTGDELTAIKADLEEKGWSDDAKQALLDCLDKIVWKDEAGPEYRETLEALLYGRAPSTIEKIWANGVGLSISGTQEMSVITNTKRGIIYNKSGEVPLVSTAQTEGAVYPIPIPAGATGVKFHGMQETDYITLNMQILKYEDGKWLQVAAAGFSKIVPDVLCRTELTYRNDGTYYMVGTYGLADATHTNPQDSRGNVTIDTSGFEMEVII